MAAESREDPDVIRGGDVQFRAHRPAEAAPAPGDGARRLGRRLIVLEAAGPLVLLSLWWPSHNFLTLGGRRSGRLTATARRRPRVDVERRAVVACERWLGLEVVEGEGGVEGGVLCSSWCKRFVCKDFL